jgi:hypothetical protein
LAANVKYGSENFRVGEEGREGDKEGIFSQTKVGALQEYSVSHHMA